MSQDCDNSVSDGAQKGESLLLLVNLCSGEVLLILKCSTGTRFAAFARSPRTVRVALEQHGAKQMLQNGEGVGCSACWWDLSPKDTSV